MCFTTPTQHSPSLYESPPSIVQKMGEFDNWTDFHNFFDKLDKTVKAVKKTKEGIKAVKERTSKKKEETPYEPYKAQDKVEKSADPPKDKQLEKLQAEREEIVSSLNKIQHEYISVNEEINVLKSDHEYKYTRNELSSLKTQKEKIELMENDYEKVKNLKGADIQKDAIQRFERVHQVKYENATYEIQQSKMKVYNQTQNLEHSINRTERKINSLENRQESILSNYKERFIKEVPNHHDRDLIMGEIKEIRSAENISSKVSPLSRIEQRAIMEHNGLELVS